MPRNRVACQSTPVQFVRTTLVECHQCIAKARIKRREGMRQDLHLALGIDLAKYAIDTIE